MTISRIDPALFDSPLIYHRAGQASASSGNDRLRQRLEDFPESRLNLSLLRV
jgi:hypothetical protein